MPLGVLAFKEYITFSLLLCNSYVHYTTDDPYKLRRTVQKVKYFNKESVELTLYKQSPLLYKESFICLKDIS